MNWEQFKETKFAIKCTSLTCANLKLESLTTEHACKPHNIPTVKQTVTKVLNTFVKKPSFFSLMARLPPLRLLIIVTFQNLFYFIILIL